jgi:hypothetical protein
VPTINLQVGASSDDARENSGTMNLAQTQINSSGTGQRLGFRWTNVTVPNAATITSAGSNNITNRTRTSTVAWGGTDIGAGWQTVDVTSQFQTVVNRAGWVSGNAAAALVYGVSGTDVTITTWDGVPANAAKLDIVYLTSGANPKVGRVRLTTKVGGVLTS